MERFRSVALPAAISGRLYLHSLPGRYEPLTEFEKWLAECSVSRIVCLVPLDELRWKSPGYEDFLARTPYVGKLHYFPIPDFQSPEDEAGFWTLAQTIAEALRQGERVLVHCAAGIGRTGTFATAVLLALGIPMESASHAVLAAGSRPETSLQEAFLRHSKAGNPPPPLEPPASAKGSP
jgi:hypothetical protein